MATDLAQTARERKCDICVLRGDLEVMTEALGGEAIVGNSCGYAMQPARQRPRFAQRMRFAGENQERGLKCVLRVLLVL